MGNGLPIEMMKGIGMADAGQAMTLGTLRGTLGRRISTLLAGFLGHSWHTAVHATQSKFPGSHTSWSIVGWQI